MTQQMLTCSVFRRTTIITLLCLLVRTSDAAISIDFDDRSGVTDLTSTGYGGVIWQQGPIGEGGIPGYWASVFNQGNYPHSGLGSVANAGGVGLSIGFTNPVNMSGAYAAGFGLNSAVWTTGLRAHGFNAGQETAATPWFNNISNIPAWFDMSALSNVDRVDFELVPVFQGKGIFGLDDLTFTYIPEPASLAMLSLAGAGLLFRRRR